MPAQKGNQHGATALRRYWENYDHTGTRNKPLLLRVTVAEHKYVADKAKELGISRVELVIRSVKAYDGE